MTDDSAGAKGCIYRLMFLAAFIAFIYHYNRNC